jgi:hypothetical protein
MTKKECPQHGKLKYKNTQFGGLWVCDQPGCTVKQWNGSTSTPADDETRAARRELHEMFDPLWRDHGVFVSSQGKKGRRGKAYRWLAENMNLKQEDAHFGMFDLEQCKKAKRLIQELLATP